MATERKYPKDEKQTPQSSVECNFYFMLFAIS